MRNLKRALSLALASVMLMGMMVVGTGASYTDVASTDNLEAIEVLQSVGIMTGDDKGNFNPNKNVTRNEMAVVMANLLDYNVAQYVGTAPFTDVPSWADSYVAACYTHGIVAGTSKTTYSGDASVTAAQAALMVMKALGYFQYSSDFGDDWQLATIRQATSIDIFKDVDAKVGEAMTRNDVAQIVLNALKATMVEPDDTTINVSTPDVSVQTGNIKYYQIVNSDATTYKAIKPETGFGMTNVSGYTVELGEKLYQGNLKLTSDTSDAFGRPGSKWTYKSTSIGTYSDTPDTVYTAKMSKDALNTFLGRDVVRDYTLDLYQDGALVANNVAFSNTYVLSGSSSASCGSGKGVLTEVFIDSDSKTVTVCVINTYVAQATADYSSSKSTLNVDAITAPSGMTLSSLNRDDFDLSKYKDEDFILYTAAKKGTSWTVETIAPAEVVSGNVSAYSVENYVTITGTQYDYAEKIEGKATADGSYKIEYVVGNTAAIVVDTYGYVLYVDDASISVGNYVYITATAPSGASTRVNADAYFSDGINEEITVKAMTNASGANILNTASRDTSVAGWYSFSKDSSGRYTLKAAATSKVDAASAITNSKSLFATGMTNTVTGNSNTVFIVKDKKDNVTVYTGINKVPDVTIASGTFPVSFMRSKDDSTKAASLVFVDAKNANVKNATTDSLLYTLKLDSTYVDSSDNERVYKWKVAKDGVETTLETKENWTKGVLYEDYSIDKDGYYETGSTFDTTDADKFAVTLNGTATAKIAFNDGVLRIAGTDYVISDTQVVLVMAPTTKGTGALSTVIMGDNNADYEMGSTSARSLANTFKDYNLTGTAYVVYNDKAKSDLVTTVYVVVTAASTTAVVADLGVTWAANATLAAGSTLNLTGATVNIATGTGAVSITPATNATGVAGDVITITATRTANAGVTGSITLTTTDGVTWTPSGSVNVTCGNSTGATASYAPATAAVS